MPVRHPRSAPHCQHRRGSLVLGLAELVASDTRANDNFGASVALSGTTAIVGAPGHATNAGRAYVFAKTGAHWREVAELRGSDTLVGDQFGTSVAVFYSTAVVGAPGHGDAAGRAYVFVDTSAGWQQSAELKGSDTGANDNFGSSTAVRGNTILVGALRARLECWSRLCLHEERETLATRG